MGRAGGITTTAEQQVVGSASQTNRLVGVIAGQAWIGASAAVAHVGNCWEQTTISAGVVAEKGIVGQAGGAGGYGGGAGEAGRLALLAYTPH